MFKSKIKYFLFILNIITFLFPNQVFAEKCSKEQISLFNKLANNIDIQYEHVSNNQFEIKIYNIPDEIKVYDLFGNSWTNEGVNFSLKTYYDAGKSYKFRYVPNKWNCDLEIDFSKTIYIKKYNIYSEREECKNIDYKEFKYCNPWYQGSITDENFSSELKKFHNKESENQTPVEENNEIDKNNLILFSSVGFGIIFLIIIIIVIIIKKKRSKYNAKI